MTDAPPARQNRHWLEYLATFSALLISVASLWIAIATEEANRQMVTAASWPFLQVNTSDSDAQGNAVLKFEVSNDGVGPALIETFQVFYYGKPIHSSHELMALCCGYDPKLGEPHSQPLIGSYRDGTIPNTVIRAGEAHAFFTYPETATNTKAWEMLRRAAGSRNLVATACYCSVFNECYASTFVGIHPTRVARCVQPAVPYAQ